MKLLKRVKDLTLILSVFLCFYAELVLAEALLLGKELPHMMLITGIVMAWLTLMYYANILTRERK